MYLYRNKGGEYMNILFMTLVDMKDIDSSGIYEDLLREFVKKNHQVYVASSSERRNGKKTHIIQKNNCKILKVCTGNIQKINFIQKGISTVLLEFQFVRAIKKHYKDVKFDLVLYSTPPITVAKAVEFVKKRDGAKTYLLLKDIFPQNAVDIGMMNTTGLKGFLYQYFRRKEKKLYSLSDRIGCMSQANVDYILEHNPKLNPAKVEICPNCIEPKDMSVSGKDKISMRKKYGIPLDKTVFVYGGNLGKPQGIPFLIDCLKTQASNEKVFFLIIGSGTEYRKLKAFVNKSKQQNVKLMSGLPKEDYDRMVGICDVGMIFLDYRFTIPNFPSRLLTYMQAGLPVFAATDVNTDIGKIITENGFGWWCESKLSNITEFRGIVKEIVNLDIEKLFNKGRQGFDYLKAEYSVENACKIIILEM